MVKTASPTGGEIPTLFLPRLDLSPLVSTAAARNTFLAATNKDLRPATPQRPLLRLASTPVPSTSPTAASMRATRPRLLALAAPSEFSLSPSDLKKAPLLPSASDAGVPRQDQGLELSRNDAQFLLQEELANSTAVVVFGFASPMRLTAVAVAAEHTASASVLAMVKVADMVKIALLETFLAPRRAAPKVSSLLYLKVQQEC